MRSNINIILKIINAIKLIKASGIIIYRYARSSRLIIYIYIYIQYIYLYYRAYINICIFFVFAYIYIFNIDIQIHRNRVAQSGPFPKHKVDLVVGFHPWNFSMTL